MNPVKPISSNGFNHISKFSVALMKLDLRITCVVWSIFSSICSFFESTLPRQKEYGSGTALKSGGSKFTDAKNKECYIADKSKHCSMNISEKDPSADKVKVEVYVEYEKLGIISRIERLIHSDESTDCLTNISENDPWPALLEADGHEVW